MLRSEEERRATAAFPFPQVAASSGGAQCAEAVKRTRLEVEAFSEDLVRLSQDPRISKIEKVCSTATAEEQAAHAAKVEKLKEFQQTAIRIQRRIVQRLQPAGKVAKVAEPDRVEAAETERARLEAAEQAERERVHAEETERAREQAAQAERAREQAEQAERARLDRKSTRLNSSHITRSRMPSSA